MRLGRKRFRAADANEVARADGPGPDREPAIEARRTDTYACADPPARLECRATDRVPIVGFKHFDPPARLEYRATDRAEDISIKASIHDPGQLVESQHHNHGHHDNDGHRNGDHNCHRDGGDPCDLDQPNRVRDVA